MKHFCAVVLLSVLSFSTYSQGFVAEINEEDFSALLGNRSTIWLTDGSKLRGTFVNGTLLNGYFTKIAFRLENGEKKKLTAEQVLRLSIKASTLVKLALYSEAGSSIKEYSTSDHKKALTRDSVIFERALKAKNDSTFALMQILNPGVDTKLKVFIDPQARKSTEVGMNNITLTGGENRVYLFVKNNGKAFRVKKNNYASDIKEIYGDCPMMLAELEGKDIAWKDVSSHVFTYNEICE